MPENLNIVKNGIIVILEKHGGNFKNTSLEIAGGAVNLAEQSGCGLSAVVVDSSMEDGILPALDEQAAADIEAAEPKLILTEAGPAALAMAAALALRIKGGVLNGCDGIKYSEEKGFCPVRANAPGTERLEFAGRGPLIVPVRPGTFTEKCSSEQVSRIVRLAELRAGGSSDEIQLLKTICREKHDIDISKARILVAGGRGVGSPEGFSQMKVLASLLGGETAASRALIELGWAEPSMQVGQTGKTVAPDLYIACGISGAIQHVTGMKDSKLIIAVNKNPAAPIFDVADLGIVGNIENIIPAFINLLREKKGDTNAV